jgi:hypothetical protein
LGKESCFFIHSSFPLAETIRCLNGLQLFNFLYCIQEKGSGSNNNLIIEELLCDMIFIVSIISVLLIIEELLVIMSWFVLWSVFHLAIMSLKSKELHNFYVILLLSEDTYAWLLGLSRTNAEISYTLSKSGRPVTLQETQTGTRCSSP